MILLKRFFFLATALHITFAVKPPNYIEKPKVLDKYPPKYEYNYFVANRHTQAAQGHKEIRNGDNTRGNYFVNLPKGESKTTVNYIADEWGFFPVTRYYSRGPHHRVSGHFALGQHAVERLNETNLNINEVFISQTPELKPTPIQQQAQATFPTAQVVFNPKASSQVPLIDDKPQLNNIFATNQPPHHDHQQQQIVFQSPGAFHNQQIPLLRNQEKNQNPIIFQRAQQLPLIYQFAQQHAPPQVNYYYPQKPQEVIYHQQPIASMAPSQVNNQHQQQLVFIDETQQVLPTAQPSNVALYNGNINVDSPQASASQEINTQEETLSLQSGDGVNGDLFRVQQDTTNNAASDNQEQAKIVDDIESAQDDFFQSPIVVGDQQSNFLSNSENETVVVQQKSSAVVFQNYQPPQKQFNIQILTEVNASQESDQYLKETSVAPKVVNGHTNSNNYQYLVEDDQDLLDSTPSPKSEAPSRQFLKKFKNFRTYESSTTATSFSTSTSRTITSSSENGCCKDNSNINCCKSKSEEKILEIPQRPLANTFLAPVHAGIRLTNENLDDCVDEKPVLTPTIVEVEKHVNIKNVLIQEQPERIPVYGDRIIVSSTPTTRVVTQPIFIEKTKTEIIQQPIIYEKQHHTEVVHPPIIIEKPVIKEVHVPIEKSVYIKTPPKFIDRPVYIQSPPQTKFVEKIVHQPVEVEKIVEKIVDRPVYIKSPPETKVIQEQVFVEKPVIKEVQVPVEKTVYVKSPPETKIVHQPIIQTVEKPVYIEKIVDRPVIQTVEKIIDRPVQVEKYIDRPYPVPYAVAVPYEKHVYHNKPDFHVYAKAIPQKHKLFDFDSLFGFLTSEKKVKHIYVPASHQHQLKQLNQHQLIKSTITTIDPVQEAPVFDYSRYATTHLNPIKPVYGVPSTPLAPVNTGYNYPNPYAGNYAYEQLNAARNIATIPSSWVNDNIEAQQSQVASQAYAQQVQEANAQQVQAEYSQQVQSPSQEQSHHHHHHDSYVGPTPLSEDYWAINGVSTKEGIKFRRNAENGRSFRIEYGGFLPKMSPSIEIDQNGMPLKKEEN